MNIALVNTESHTTWLPLHLSVHLVTSRRKSPLDAGISLTSLTSADLFLIEKREGGREHKRQVVGSELSTDDSI